MIHTENHKKNIHKADKIKLLSQGAYGCVFHPGSTCRGNIENKKFVRKIQADNDNNQKEIELGQKIKTIKHYKDHFAPILDSCPVSIGSIDNDEIKKCDIIYRSGSKYVSNKISFIGKKTFGEYFVELYESSPKTFFKMIFQTHIDLLDSLRMLSDTNIVHMDLKDDNIMLNNKNKPIIIDFGLSMDTTNLKTDEELKKAFWIFEDYMPWCFDIIAINSITQSQNNWDSTIIIENDIPLLCNVVIDHCELLHMKFGDKPIFEEAEIEEYKTNIMNYMKSFINQSWRTVIDALLKFTKTWDTYSLCYIYLNLMKVTLVYKVDNSFIHSYIGLLKQNILSTPDKRFDAATMKKELLKISQNINKSDIHKIHETIHTHSKEHGFFDILRQKHAEHTLHLLQKKTKLVNVR